MRQIFRLPALLDGATGTNLIRAGMPQGVCQETWVLDHPQVMLDLQRAYVEAGSDAVMAPTFETSSHKLAKFGLGDQAAELALRLVALSREAVGGRALVAGDMAPTGLMIEPFGDMTFEELTGIFRSQAFALRDAKADYIALETFMSLTEARAALLAAKETGLPVTVSLTVEAKGRLLSGGDVTACLATLAAMGADAVGLNCSTGPEMILGCLRAAAVYTRAPLIAKPNAGLPKADEPGVYDYTPENFAAYVPAFLGTGATIVGGCCGTTPAHIAAMRRMLDASAPLGKNGLGDCAAARFAADERHIFPIGEGALRLTDPIDCGDDLADCLADAAEEDVDAVRVRIRTKDDAAEFGRNAYLCTLPVALLSDSATALEAALRVYQGRALIDGASDVPRETLGELEMRYGAVIL